jgi:mannitol-1-phosphate/altronate dehydrogenase
MVNFKMARIIRNEEFAKYVEKYWENQRKLCEAEGHDFEFYSVQVGSRYENYFEQAGQCKRCGFDTHE